jgi:hypothetical protein
MCIEASKLKEIHIVERDVIQKLRAEEYMTENENVSKLAPLHIVVRASYQRRFITPKRSQKRLIRCLFHHRETPSETSYTRLRLNTTICLLRSARFKQGLRGIQMEASAISRHM